MDRMTRGKRWRRMAQNDVHDLCGCTLLCARDVCLCAPSVTLCRLVCVRAIVLLVYWVSVLCLIICAVCSIC